MADDTTSTALAPTRANRPTIIVQSAAAIFDSGRFEHLYRVATVMAKAGLMPDSLTTVKVKGERGGSDQILDLPLDVVIARAFLIAARAERWNMDPLALMNCAYLAHNKLGFEGKVVNAAIQGELGIVPKFEFGAWDPKTMRVMIGATPAQPELLGIVVSATLPGESSPASIEGYVGAWKYDFSGKELPAWKSPGSWHRMLCYRGIREFGNVHCPQVTMGVLTDDDFASPDSPQIQFLDAPTLDDAFGRQKAPKRVAAKPMQPEVTESTKDPQPAPPAEQPKDTLASATGASGDSPAKEASGPKQPDEPSGDGEKGAREADASALQKSSAGDKSATETASPTAAEVVHALHTGQGIDTDDKGNVVSLADRKAPTTIDEIRAAQQTDNDRIIEQTRGIAPQSGDDPVDPATDPNVPEDPEVEVDVQAFNDFARDITQVGNWGAMKPILVAFRASEAFGSANPDLQGKALKLAWEPCALWPFPEGDVDFYRLWIETTAQPHEVRPAFRKLMRGAEYQNLDPETRDLVVDETNHAAGDS